MKHPFRTAWSGITAAFLVSVFIYWGPFGSRSAEDRATQEDSICIAIFQSFLERRTVTARNGAVRNEAGESIHLPENGADPNLFTVFFLEREDGKDPSPKVMQTFEAHNPLVKRVSESFVLPAGSVEKDSDLTIRDKQTREKGLIYRVGKVRWIGKNEITVKAGYYGGILYSRSDVYRLNLERGKWRITEIEYGPVS